MSVISTFTLATSIFSGYRSSRILCSQWISTPARFKGTSGNANPVTKSHVPDNLYPQQCKCGNYKPYQTLHCTLNWSWAREKKRKQILPPPHLPSNYRVIHEFLQDFRPLRYNIRDGYAAGEHVNRGRESLQVFLCTKRRGVLAGFTARRRS
jgi:hypothetical protein